MSDGSDFDSDFQEDSDDVWFSNMNDKPNEIKETSIDTNAIEQSDNVITEEVATLKKSEVLGTNDVNV